MTKCMEVVLVLQTGWQMGEHCSILDIVIINVNIFHIYHSKNLTFIKSFFSVMDRCLPLTRVLVIKMLKLTLNLKNTFTRTVPPVYSDNYAISVSSDSFCYFCLPAESFWLLSFWQQQFNYFLYDNEWYDKEIKEKKSFSFFFLGWWGGWNQWNCKARPV